MLASALLVVTALLVVDDNAAETRHRQTLFRKYRPVSVVASGGKNLLKFNRILKDRDTNVYY